MVIHPSWQKSGVRTAQPEALRAVNKELVALYRNLGRVICERPAGGTGWGRAVVEQLAAGLRADFPGIGGFSLIISFIILLAGTPFLPIAHARARNRLKYSEI
jgi:hypothetical protein